MTAENNENTTTTDSAEQVESIDITGAAESPEAAEAAEAAQAAETAETTEIADQPDDESVEDTDPEAATESSDDSGESDETGAEAEGTEANEDAQQSEESAFVDPLAVIFQAPDLSAVQPVPSRRRRQDDSDDTDETTGGDDQDDSEQTEGDADQGQERSGGRSRSRRRRQRGRGSGSGSGTGSDQNPADSEGADDSSDASDSDSESGSSSGDESGTGSVSRRRRRRRRGEADLELEGGSDGDPEHTVTRVRAPRQASSTGPQGVTSLKGSTRLEAKKQRRRESRQGNRRRHVITEAEFLARRESVDRKMLVRQREHRIQIAVMEDGVLAEHFVSNTTQDSLIGNVYLGKVQNVLPSMEAAFVDIGRGRNAVLYAGEVNWDAAQLDGKPKKIENALKSGDSVLVQVTKDPVGHKGARLTSQISLPGRYLVYVPGGSMTGISRKLPDVERARLKKILKDHLPGNAGVIVRTAAEGTSEQELMNDINRLRSQWEGIEASSTSTKVLAPELLYSEPDLTIKVVRDVFNEDFSGMVVQGDQVWDNIEAYVTYVAPHLLDRVEQWKPEDHDGEDLFAGHRIDEQLHKALERKVYLPSGGSLVIDRTEAMTVVDVNTGKFTGSGGNLEETVTKNNLEAAEEIVRQLRLRDIGGIIVIDFIDMVLESNRDLVLRRLVECLGRDRTKHQVAEVTSLGLVQMTRKRMGTGLVEVFSETCEACNGRGIITHDVPVEHRRAHNSHGEPRSGRGDHGGGQDSGEGSRKSSRSERRRRNRERQAEKGQAEHSGAENGQSTLTPEEEAERQARAEAARAAFATIAAATTHHAEDSSQGQPDDGPSPEQASSGQEQAEQEAQSSSETPSPEPTEDTTEQIRARGGRRRSRRAGSAQSSAEVATQDGTGQESERKTSSASVLTLGGEAVEVPQGTGRSRGRSSADLTQLENALDSRQRQPRSSAAPSAETDAPARPARRRRRAASSDGTGADIQTVEIAPGTASGSTFSATAGQASSSSGDSAQSAADSSAAPMMLGVGVKAEDIARTE